MYVFVYRILVPGLRFAKLDDYEQSLLSFNSNKITLETYLKMKKQSLTKISKHPVKMLTIRLN